MPKIHYHPCPQALGEYNYLTDTIILHKGLKRYRKIHDSILSHEQEHARIFKEHNSWLKRLALNVKQDYEARITGATRVPIELLRELNPSTLKDSLYQTFYILAYIPILVIEGIYYTIKSLLDSR
ncbi:hypothetical protein E4H04_05260 [Candidatus Bathyarchaeota archaeon]|nr:MAG: hypothetical protein E4H04_05260 [Candidatus Bathyarchaeota archaeon]